MSLALEAIDALQNLVPEPGASPAHKVLSFFLRNQLLGQFGLVFVVGFW